MRDYLERLSALVARYDALDDTRKVSVDNVACRTLNQGLSELEYELNVAEQSMIDAAAAQAAEEAAKSVVSTIGTLGLDAMGSLDDLDDEDDEGDASELIEKGYLTPPVSGPSTSFFGGIEVRAFNADGTERDLSGLPGAEPAAPGRPTDAQDVAEELVSGAGANGFEVPDFVPEGIEDLEQVAITHRARVVMTKAQDGRPMTNEDAAAAEHAARDAYSAMVGGAELTELTLDAANPDRAVAYWDLDSPLRGVAQAVRSIDGVGQVSYWLVDPNSPEADVPVGDTAGAVEATLATQRELLTDIVGDDPDGAELLDQFEERTDATSNQLVLRFVRTDGAYITDDQFTEIEARAVASLGVQLGDVQVVLRDEDEFDEDGDTRHLRLLVLEVTTGPGAEFLTMLARSGGAAATPPETFEFGQVVATATPVLAEG